MIVFLTNSNDLVVNSLSLVEENKIIDVKELFLSKLDSIDSIVGLAPETLNTLAKLGEAINNDSNFYQTLITDLSFKANVADTYRQIETFSNTEVNDKMAQAQTQLTSQLSSKANVSSTYTRTVIDDNIKALRDETTTKLELYYTMEQTMSSYDLNSNFSQTIADYTEKIALNSDLTSVYTKTQVDNFRETSNADYTAKLALKTNEEDTIKIYESPLEKRTVDHPFKVGTVNQLSLSSTFIDSVNAKEPAFIVMSPIIKNTDNKTGIVELKLSPDFTVLVNEKITEEQVRTLVNNHDPYILRSPLEKGRNIKNDDYEIRTDMSYYESLNSKADVADTYTKEETDLTIIQIYPWLIGNPQGYNTIQAGSTGLNIYAGMETILQIGGVGNAGNEGKTWFYKYVLFFQEVEMQRTLTAKMLKMKGPSGGGSIRCIPESNNTESSIGFYTYTDERAVNAGDMWVAGQGSWNKPGFSIGTQVKGACLNINSAGVVSAPYYITTPEVVTDSIRASTADHLTVNDNVIITGNLTVNGNILDAANPYWVAGKVNGATLDQLSSKGRHTFNVVRVPGNAAGVYEISFSPAHPAGDHYVIFLTCGSNHHYTREGFGSSTKFQIVLTSAGNSALDTMFHFAVLA
jgi:hypothetical protein